MNAMVPILMYHSVSSDASPRFRRFTVAPSRFHDHLQYLRDAGYSPITITNLVDGRSGRMPLPDRPVVLTFDDGFADFYTTALPTLQRYSFSATLYVVTGYVGGDSAWLRREGEAHRPMVSWVQIRQIMEGGVEIGAHGHSHRPLDLLPPETLREELTSSKFIIEQHIGQSVRSFAYPHGWFTRRVRQAVAHAGYTSACAVRRAPSVPDDDSFALSRLEITAETDVLGLRALLTSAPNTLKKTSEAMRIVGWRTVRRALRTETPPIPSLGHLWDRETKGA